MFTITPDFMSARGRGFQITFDNGVMVSVQWGCGNYCDNRRIEHTDENSNLVSHTAEFAAIDTRTGKFVINEVIGCDNPYEWQEEVRGYLNADEVLMLMNLTAKYVPMKRPKVWLKKRQWEDEW